MAKLLVPEDVQAVIEPLLPPEQPKPEGGRPSFPDRAALSRHGKRNVAEATMAGHEFLIGPRVCARGTVAQASELARAAQVLDRMIREVSTLIPCFHVTHGQ